jgi:hypothetical protein
MRWIFDEVPWGNLWRTVVTTYLFFLLLGMPLTAFTSLDTGVTASLFKVAVLLVAAVLAAIVVWSDTVQWVGDTYYPERR